MTLLYSGGNFEKISSSAERAEKLTEISSVEGFSIAIKLSPSFSATFKTIFRSTELKIITEII